MGNKGISLLWIWLGVAQALDLSPKNPRATINSLYGFHATADPFFLSFLQHPAIKRLKNIDVVGPSRYFRQLPAYSAFDHTFGVWALAKRFNLDMKAQVASLIQCVAYSVFGEFGDFMFDTTGSDIFRLDTLKDYLQHSKLSDLLDQHGYTQGDISPDRHPAIWAAPPEVSLREMELVLRLAFSYKMISLEEIKTLLGDITLDKGRWLFKEVESARKLGDLSLYFSEKLWGADVTYVINLWFGNALKRALQLHVLRLDDLRFKTDTNVLKALINSQDNGIRSLLVKCKNPHTYFRQVHDGNYAVLYKPSFRGMDPWVKKGSAPPQRLSGIDKDFRQAFERVKGAHHKGFKIRFRQGQSNTSSDGMSPWTEPTPNTL
jgi:hypothetical protein